MIETDGKVYIIKLSNGMFAQVFTATLARALDRLKPDEADTFSVFLDIVKVAVDEKTLLYKVLPAIFNGEIKLNFSYKLEVPEHLSYLL